MEEKQGKKRLKGSEEGRILEGKEAKKRGKNKGERERDRGKKKKEIVYFPLRFTGFK